MQNPEIFRELKKEGAIEKEKRPSKVILFIRHPSVKWINRLLEQAEAQEKDIETYVPVDVEGIKMSRLLSEYLKENLTLLFKEKKLSQKFSIITSPIRRAKSLADNILTNLKLAHTENPEISIPINNIPIEMEALEEMPWIENKKEALNILQEAKQKNMHPVQYWFEKEPDKAIAKLNKQIPKIKEGLESLRNPNTSLDLVFTHRVSEALILWIIEQLKTGRKDLTVTKEDLPEIVKLCGKIAYTSISEVWLTPEGEWHIESIGETPHLTKEPALIKGTY